MFAAGAYEIAELYDVTPPRSVQGEPAHEAAPALPLTDPAALTLAACASCQSALGECAVQAARAGAMSPVMALALCTSMHRAIERTLAAPTASLAGYVAFVLFGGGRSEASRRGDLDSRAETMRKAISPLRQRATAAAGPPCLL